MFNVNLSVDDLVELKEYMESGNFVQSMNDAGLSLPSMAFALGTLNNAINEFLTKFDKE